MTRKYTITRGILTADTTRAPAIKRIAEATIASKEKRIRGAEAAIESVDANDGGYDKEMRRIMFEKQDEGLADCDSAAGFDMESESPPPPPPPAPPPAPPAPPKNKERVIIPGTPVPVRDIPAPAGVLDLSANPGSIHPVNPRGFMQVDGAGKERSKTA